MFKDNKKLKYILIYGSMVLGMIFMVNYTRTIMTTKEIPYNEFNQMLKDDQVKAVQIARDKITIEPKKDTKYAGKTLYTVNVGDPDLIKDLNTANVTYNGIISNGVSVLDIALSWILPLLIFFLIGKLLFGRMDKKMGGGVMSFGKNTAKLYAEDETGKTFKDVAGQEEAKESLVEIVDFLHDPNKYTEIGAKLPKGALLVGPPGTGKTLLAKAVAGEAKVPFFSMSGSDFVEMFVGMGAARVRDLFRQAEEKAPCIVFIDEIDAIGKSRDGAIQGNDEREQTLNQLLSEMDGFDSSKGVVILAATNRPEILDKALLRPGRFDRRVIVDRPDLQGREAILKVHAKDVRLADNVDFLSIAKSTPGAVGADLANIVNEAALRAVKHNRKTVIQEDLEEAVEVIIAGKEKKDRILSEKEKKIVAFHEVGHALVAALLKNTDPVHKITIVPRTMGALGYTMQQPEEDKYLVTKEEMLSEISTLLGGRAAEEVEFNTISTGASNDIERATQSARSMVTIYGMTDKFDMMALESVTNRYLDGRPVQNCSAKTAAIIDQEALAIIKECHRKSIDILKNNRDLLSKISEALLEKETLLGNEFMEFIYEKYPEMKKEVEEKEKKKAEIEAKKKEILAERIAEREELQRKAQEIKKLEDQKKVLEQIHEETVDLDGNNSSVNDEIKNYLESSEDHTLNEEHKKVDTDEEK
ncbi:ATP-dependent zinc metalloprotease FtsH [Clostridium fallax]|uniref:ATP-dependent zinc metalloprotease FtsH n=1 Tax=Clostridium fallax TaxID=1533 RepID=A0A1M4XQ62_9CLOT|nr:ATP-dependent zinc metalloprotease FtsH [Clostridium fallax]SHE95561.1 membrane protease FtsH catalytic subunit [Clostridium fallax]SQB08088.1 ATP-dependent metalloprotease FtsH [Clostridium fallax]